MKFYSLLAIIALTSAVKLESFEEAAVQELSETSMEDGKNGVKIGKRRRGKKMGKKILMGKKIGVKRMRRRAGGKEEEVFEGENSEDAYGDIYDEYDQLAQDFKQCKVYGEALRDTAPSQICVEERERIRALHQMVAEEAQAFIDQADDEDLNIKNVGKIKVTPDQISALNEIDELMKKAQRFETEFTKDKAPLPAPVFEQAMARIVDVMRIAEGNEPRPIEMKKV